MAEGESDRLDFQFTIENVGFLDNELDNSHLVQDSLKVVENYVNVSACEANTSGFERSANRVHSFTQNKTISNNASRISKHDNISQCSNITSKRLIDWGLPLEIVKKYEERGIKEMFSWQVNCLGNTKVLFDCCNLVYSAPTSAGKTLVAEILTIKTILERQKKVIIILPFVSIVREKTVYFQDILSSSGIRVEGFSGSQTPPGGLQAVHVAICTIEKANSLINKLLEDDNITNLGAVIVDELHLLGDPHRGYILELLLTKIKYITAHLNLKIQVIGMSATLPNLEQLAIWLEAELFITKFRPIPLDEFCLIGNKYYDRCGNFTGLLDSVDGDHVLKICLNTIEEGCSILIFCMTKNGCENLAEKLALSFYKLGCSKEPVGTMLREQLKAEIILDVLEQLKNCPVGIDKVLKHTISFGVAYHHAGLTYDERDIIEGAFKSGAIRVLVATSTLSSGVNLPARKVIIRSPVFQKKPIDMLSYKQMAGRAGRMGKDVKGESILICTEAEKNVGLNLMMSSLKPVMSCLEYDEKLKRAILEIIACQVASTLEQLEMYSKCTLFFSQGSTSLHSNVGVENLHSFLKELMELKLVRIQSDNFVEHYLPTLLGKACLSSSMAPDDGLTLFCELQKARQHLALDSDLHLIYLVTPYSVSNQWASIDWFHLSNLWQSLTAPLKRAGLLVGIQESFIVRCIKGSLNRNHRHVQANYNLHGRFYTALALHDLVNEVPLSEVATKFQCSRGFLQTLQQGAATFAGMVSAFCRQLGWKNMEILVSQFQERLQFGIHSELIDLMKLSSLNGRRARALYNAGFENVTSIASSNVNIVENVLYKDAPFESEMTDEDEGNRRRSKIRNIKISGHNGMTVREAAENIILEARKYLEHEMGGARINWGEHDITNSENTHPEICTKEEIQCDSFIELNPPALSSPGLTELNNEFKSNTKVLEDIPTTIKNEDNTCEENDVDIEPNIKEESSIINESINEDIQLNYLISISQPRSLNASKSIMKDIEDILTDINDKSSSTALQNSKQEKDLVVIPNRARDFVTNESAIKSEFTEENNCNHVLFEKQNGTEVKALNKVLEKDDIMWDSLSFSETAIENITKLETPGQTSSPLISEDKVAVNNVCSKTSRSSITVKDISLFSSEGDNSSLFEESLPLGGDKKPIVIANTDNVNASNNELLILVDKSVASAVNNKNIGNSTRESKDAKLYDYNMEIVSPLKRRTEHTNSVISPKRTKNNIFLIEPVKRYTNTTNKSKKIQRLNTIKEQNIKLKLVCNEKEQMKLIASNSYKMDINISKSEKCHLYVLRGRDIVDYLNYIKNLQNVSIYIDFERVHVDQNNVIGGCLESSNSKLIQKQNVCPIRSISLYCEENICFFLEISSLKVELSEFISRLVTSLSNIPKLITIFVKHNYLAIKKKFGIDLPGNILDISLAHWIINSEEKVRDFNYLMKYIGIKSLLMTNMKKRMMDAGTIPEYVLDECFKVRSVWFIALELERILMEQFENATVCIDREMYILKILTACEYHGIAIDKDLAKKMLEDVQKTRERLEKVAYKLAGRRFNFNSQKEVAQVLYAGKSPYKRTTGKNALMMENTPLAHAIVYYRKLEAVLSNTLFPLNQFISKRDSDNRIYPSYSMYTCTGRICMNKPNLQLAPRTFSIPLELLPPDGNPEHGEVVFNCRDIIVASKDHTLVSADYCQLEMRILTHLCGDQTLTTIMNSDVDVFKSIASSWSDVPMDEVDDELRQRAKQVCYGIIYGMGALSLSMALDIPQAEASSLLETFHQRYPAIQKYTDSVAKSSHKCGYVETMTHRRRYIKELRYSPTSRTGSGAQRKAINTKIQGSAADITKMAMCAIDSRISGTDIHLIIQMHDELIYEVPEEKVDWFISVLRDCMENPIRLNVPLPVKVKSGYKWGSLMEIPRLKLD